MLATPLSRHVHVVAGLAHQHCVAHVAAEQMQRAITTDVGAATTTSQCGCHGIDTAPAERSLLTAHA